MVFGQDLIADMVNGTAADSKLREPDHHDRNDNDGRIETKPCCTKQPGKDDPYRKVAERHHQVAAQDAEDVAQVGSFRQSSGNKKML